MNQYAIMEEPDEPHQRIEFNRPVQADISCLNLDRTTNRNHAAHEQPYMNRYIYLTENRPRPSTADNIIYAVTNLADLDSVSYV